MKYGDKRQVEKNHWLNAMCLGLITNSCGTFQAVKIEIQGKGSVEIVHGHRITGWIAARVLASCSYNVIDRVYNGRFWKTLIAVS